MASNAHVTSGKPSHVPQADFTEWGEETVLHRVKSWKRGSVMHIWGLMESTSWWVGVLLKVASLAKAIQNSSGLIFAKQAMANTLTSVSTVHTYVFTSPFYSICNVQQKTGVSFLMRTRHQVCHVRSCAHPFHVFPWLCSLNCLECKHLRQCALCQLMVLLQVFNVTPLLLWTFFMCSSSSSKEVTFFWLIDSLFSFSTSSLFFAMSFQSSATSLDSLLLSLANFAILSCIAVIVPWMFLRRLWMSLRLG